MSRSGSARTAPSSGVIFALCALIVLADGYDLVVYGNIVPSLLDEPGWNLTASEAGRIGAVVLVGMMIGALLAGVVADRFGQRRTIAVGVAWFSIAMGFCALAPSPGFFAIFRGLGGLGLGAIFPLVTAVVLEFAPPARKTLAYSFTLSGYLVGGIVCGGLGLIFIPALGWRSMFWAGAAIGLILVPIAWRVLPESPAWLLARGQEDESRAIAVRYGVTVADAPVAKVKASAIFCDGLRARTLFAWSIQFCSLLLVFGMVNWLPTIMVSLGYDIQSALLFAIVLNVGAAAGAFTGSRYADKGALPVVTAMLFLLGAASIVALSLSSFTLLMFILVGLAGAGTIGTQMLVNVLIGAQYPTPIRAAGLGWALGIGRLGGLLGPIIGGIVISAGLPPRTSFYVFAGVGLLGAALVVPFILWQKGPVSQQISTSEKALISQSNEEKGLEHA